VVLLLAAAAFGNRWLQKARKGDDKMGNDVIFYGFYVIAIIVLVLHFTGWLRRNNLEWVVLVVAAATFPVVIFFSK
jgi:hypothetical protein